MKAFAFALLTSAACATVEPGAEIEGDFACVNTPWQTTAADPMAIAGRIVDEVGGGGIAGASVEIRAVADDALLAATGVNDAGNYDLAVVTRGSAPLAYRHASAAGFLDSYAYDARPMIGGDEHELMLTPADAASLYATVNLVPDPHKSTLLVIATDCNGWGVRGATVAVDGADAVMYLGDDTKFHASATATSKNSAAVILNAPVGELDVEVDAGDISYRSSPIVGHANGFTASWRRP